MPEGFIVIAACKDEFTTNLSQIARGWLEGMGSKETSKLEYRCGYVFIGISGGLRPAHEQRALKPSDAVYLTSIF